MFQCAPGGGAAYAPWIAPWNAQLVGSSDGRDCISLTAFAYASVIGSNGSSDSSSQMSRRTNVLGIVASWGERGGRADPNRSARA